MFFDNLTDDTGDIEAIVNPQVSQEFTCPFCKKAFSFDADTAEMRNYARSYGCGCIPECIIDACFTEGINKAQIQQGIKVTAVDSNSYRNRAGFYITVAGKRIKIVPVEYSSDNANIERYMERNTP